MLKAVDFQLIKQSEYLCIFMMDRRITFLSLLQDLRVVDLRQPQG
jgi:hypothetical protein